MLSFSFIIPWRDFTTKGKIYPKNANAVPHILQDKHAWEKVVTIKEPIRAKGNIEENFKAVATLLEEEGIMPSSFFTPYVISFLMSGVHRGAMMLTLEMLVFLPAGIMRGTKHTDKQ